MSTHLRPYWSARLADARKAKFPVLRGAVDADVAILGGGLIGCAAAYLFASAGVRVALLEADRIGGQGTAGAPGVVLPEPAVPLATLDAVHGRRAARAMWETCRRSAFDFVALLKRLGIRADVEAAETYTYLAAGEDARTLDREATLRRDMGIEGQWLAPAKASTQLMTDLSGAIRVKAGALFDPYRACLGLARAARSHRAQVFERSAAANVMLQAGTIETPRRVRTGHARDAERVLVVTARGAVTASRVIVATGGPTKHFQPLARRFTSLLGYRVVTEPLPAALRRRVAPSGVVLREATSPGHLLRWTRDNRLLFAGIERLRLPDRSRPAALAQHSAQLMYELSLLFPELSGVQAEYAWDSPASASDDGLPYIGPHRHYPRLLFALGAGRSDGGTALMAARILLRQYEDAPDKSDALWGFGR